MSLPIVSHGVETPQFILLAQDKDTLPVKAASPKLRSQDLMIRLIAIVIILFEWLTAK
jgi:hypothetical protein